MAEISKPIAKLGDVFLAGVTPIQWSFTPGVAPYQTVFAVHRGEWDKLKSQMGQPLQLKITDRSGKERKIEQVYILSVVPSTSPNHVSFLVSDLRWRWPYRIVCRDFNIPRKTGNRTALQNNLPVEAQQVVDEYDYLEHSLNAEGKRWTARDAVREVLRIAETGVDVAPAPPSGPSGGEGGSGGAPSNGGEPSGGQGGEGGGDHEIVEESWPIKDFGGTNTGDFALQGVSLRDPGDAAVARMMSYVPGAGIYVNDKAEIVIFDATDLDALEDAYRNLPRSSWEGEKVEWVDRKAIRPSEIVVHYQREMELLLRYEDDYASQTSTNPDPNQPYLENVIPTVDPETTLYEYDPVKKGVVEKKVPPGTWVEVSEWLYAMEQARQDAEIASFPWVFETIRIHWLKGDLESALGARKQDTDPKGLIAARVAALRQHFRQTFRLNRRYSNRFASLRAVRVGLLDSVTGARAPASVWGQAAAIPTQKYYMLKRGDDAVESAGVYRNIDHIKESKQSGGQIIETAPSPARVVIVDEQLGIFRLEWIASPYGTIGGFIPSLLASDGNPTGDVPTGDLAFQDSQPMGVGFRSETGTGSIFLAPKMEFAALLTVVANAPNNRSQFHQVRIDANKVLDLYRREFRIEDGDGPPMEVFVAPGEATARFALANESEAVSSHPELFGMVEPDKENPSVDPQTGEIKGYVLMNDERHLTGHAQAVAAEYLIPYADTIQGTVVTDMPDSLKLAGNMSSATMTLSQAPSAKLRATHHFPGAQRVISRYAMMPEATRRQLLGILPYKQ